MHVDVLAAARAEALHERGAHGPEGDVGGRHVGDRATRAGGRIARLAGREMQIGRFYQRGNVRIRYGTYGRLNAAHDNAILLPSHYMADHHGYDFLIGPGNALDTTRYFLVATEMFGNGLARCLAEEGGPDGIRVNTVNPDAVLSGSRIWDSSWREERAAAYGIAPDELEEHYRARTTLGVNIEPDDVASAVLHFASGARSGKSTGNILNVDGGVAAAYPR